MSITIGLDILLLSIIICSAIFGLYNGAIRVIIGSALLLCAAIGAYFIYPFILELFQIYFTYKTTAIIYSSIATCALSIIAFIVIKFVAFNIIIIIPKTNIDKIFGLILGIIRGVILSFALFLLIMGIYCRSYVHAKTVFDLFDYSGIDQKNISWAKDSFMSRNFDKLRIYMMSYNESWLKSKNIKGDVDSSKKHHGADDDKEQDGYLLQKVNEIISQ
ncbi:MAG: CvpA family protein [Rickettsiaceae bacterium]